MKKTYLKIMSGIAKNIEEIQHDIAPYHAVLIAVSKTKPLEVLQEAYDSGQRDFGENKVQELVQKSENMPKDVRWHMIGHMQRNKVKFITPFIYLIHSVDSVRLLKTINKEAGKSNSQVNCLLQVHIAKEDTKFGFSETELISCLESEELPEMKNVRIRGLMGMATFTENKDQVKSEFSYLNGLFETLKNRFADIENIDFDTLSMGMSGDYKLALECGSSMVRVGTSIFGDRNYG